MKEANHRSVVVTENATGIMGGAVADIFKRIQATGGIVGAAITTMSMALDISY